MITTRSRSSKVKELTIFDNFIIDSTLTKNKDKTTISSSVVSDNRIWIQQDIQGVPHVHSGWFPSKEQSKLVKYIKSKFKRKPDTRKLTILDFFKLLPENFNDLKSFENISDQYEKALLQANELGQIALADKLTNQIVVAKYELQLIQYKLTKYVTEKQLITFYEQVKDEKNLKLTWIKNFTRVIPEDVYALKKASDSYNVFDNYVILHYDPNEENEELTEEEKEKKKDPILFGVIQNSRKLYYIADWKDEFCDLTLEEMFTTLSDKPKKLSMNTIKSEIK